MIARFGRLHKSYSVLLTLFNRGLQNHPLNVKISRRYTATAAVQNAVQVQKAIKKRKTSSSTNLKKSHKDKDGQSYDLASTDGLTKQPKNNQVPQVIKKKNKHNPSETLNEVDLAQLRLQQKKLAMVEEVRNRYEAAKLHSYLEVCVSLNQVERAIKILQAYEKSRAKSVIEICHYNLILRGCAFQGRVKKVIDWRVQMIERGIAPNLETYAYILYAYAKKNMPNNHIRAILQDLRNTGLEPKKIFQWAYFGPREREDIRACIRKVESDYEDEFIEAPINYDCKLLEGLHHLPYSAHNLGIDATSDKLMSWAEHQQSVESKSSVNVISIAKSKQYAESNRKYELGWERFLDISRNNLKLALIENMQVLQQQSDSSAKIHLYPYLASISNHDLVNLMVDEVESSARNTFFSLSATTLHIDLGSKVYTLYQRASSISDSSLEEKMKLYYEYITDYCCNSDLMGQINPREFIQERAYATKNYGIYVDRIRHQAQWPVTIRSAIGRFLYGLIMREVKFDPDMVRYLKEGSTPNNSNPAFYTAYMQIGNTHKNKEEFRAHKDIEKLCMKACDVRLKFNYNFLPTTSPPMPWLSSKFGGYLTNKSDLIRVGLASGEESLLQRKSTTNYQQLYPSLDSLNVLGLCPWKVNIEILDLAIELFRAGGNYDLAIPLNEKKMEQDAPVLKRDASKADKILYLREKARYDQKKREMFSLWSDCLYRLSIANHFREQIFWLPHNMDFRGRTYAIPPHFNHLGADLARSLLLFAKGKPLGQNGLDWLKIHLINLIGSKKSCTLTERLDYANSILNTEVLDSAKNPWTGRKWWTMQEHPWQVLACCKEISNALKLKDPREYICHFAVHQDGSCNGLQHYAALGRDSSGAIAVNLVPNERPQDVYSRVVDIVEAKRKKDALQGNQFAQSLEGYIKRKVIKQTVMTTVYGVTRYGARSQIARQLVATNFPEDQIWMGASYLAGRTFESITQVFNASRKIQNWLNDCASVIASRFLQPVTWVTPLGFTVVQPYAEKRAGSNRFMAKDMSNLVAIHNDPNALNLNISKQRSAFPPNYIHSLDSTHMMLTSIHCQRLAISFVSVHDCYWTHPSSVDAMNKVCREQFVLLHEQPLLKLLSSQFLDRYASYLLLECSSPGQNKNSASSLAQMLVISSKSSKIKARQILNQPPQQGDLDLQLVLKSTYFFS